MYKKTDDINEIHLSLVNGQRRQAVGQIDDYGTYDFWNDYKEYLTEQYGNGGTFPFHHFTDMTISYFKIKNK